MPKQIKHLKWYGEIPKWLYENGNSLTFEEYETILDYYYSEREWNSNSD
jgi:hypothetical protein